RCCGVARFAPHAEARQHEVARIRFFAVVVADVEIDGDIYLGPLEEAHIKLSSLVSDLLGTSARRMLQALADGETDPATLAALADTRLRATPAQLRDALGACSELNPVYRRLLKMALKELQLIDEQIGQLDQEMASL